MRVAVVFPHQLYRPHPAIEQADSCVLIEDPLFFSQYAFHWQKLVLHRASMKHYAEELTNSGVQVHYLDCRCVRDTNPCDVLKAAKQLAQLQPRELVLVDPCDDWLLGKMQAICAVRNWKLTLLSDPHELTSPEDFRVFRADRKKLFFTEFYIQQRQRLDILVDEHQKPWGGKWSFDVENRKKLPKSLVLPKVMPSASTEHRKEAIQYVTSEFPHAFAHSATNDVDFRYPVTPSQARQVLNEFLQTRLSNFGPYEDAIDRDETYLFHSVLTPALNIGLLSPREIIDAALAYRESVPMASLEGFVRQVIGWREFIRGVYRELGVRQRTSNFWNHQRRIPTAFYDASTGIDPVDAVIRRVQRNAYCHHIERLMVLGNFMLLCEFSPNAVYRWFMELFVDAYDWVMVPNVYGMSQFADGGLVTTKPYISGSSYVLRMSNFSKGPWCEIWDGLYWRFIHRHREFFSRNPRMSMMVRQCDRLGAKLDRHLEVADRYLKKLDESA